MIRESLRIFLVSGLVLGVVSGVLIAGEPKDLRTIFARQEAKKWASQIFQPILQSVGEGIAAEDLLARKTQLEEGMAESYRNLLEPETVQAISAWFKEEKHQSTATLAAKATDLAAVSVFTDQNGLADLPPERREKVERLRKALNKGELDAAYAFFLQAAFSRSMDVLTMEKPTATPTGSFFPLSSEEEALFQKARAKHSEQGLAGLGYAYQAIDDADLDAYLEFLETGHGKNWMAASFQANLDGMRSGAEIMYELGWKYYFDQRQKRGSKPPPR